MVNKVVIEFAPWIAALSGGIYTPRFYLFFVQTYDEPPARPCAMIGCIDNSTIATYTNMLAQRRNAQEMFNVCVLIVGPVG